MYHLVQWGIAEMGRGETEEEAITEAREYGATVEPENVCHYVGTGKTGDGFDGKMLTDKGELAKGDLVMLTAEQFAEIGYQ